MAPMMIIKRLRILQGAQAVYDEKFHSGVNIIRGENSSGKSTISDFLFYILGGEFDKWKEAASRCTAVQAEIEATQSTITLHRSISGKLEPIYIFYGKLEEASKSGIDSWDRVPIRRPRGGRELSVSQVMFRAVGIPEAPSVNDSNVTMHQIMRLLYADQQTPAGKLFRFESFDTRDIREAVGQLVIGINGYELYEGQIRLRELKAQWEEKDRLHRAALNGLPSNAGLASVATLNAKLEELRLSKEQVLRDIANVDNLVGERATGAFLAERRSSQSKLKAAADELSAREDEIFNLKDELEEIGAFLAHLREQMETMESAESVSDALGGFEFQYCPACLRPLDGSDATHCIVCDRVLDEDSVKSKYFEIKIDIELQTRETSELLRTKKAQLSEAQNEAVIARRRYSSLQAEFVAKFSATNSPREAFLAGRNKHLGGIERDIAYLEELRVTLERIDVLSEEKKKLDEEINLLDARIKRLNSNAHSRQEKALSLISAIGRRLLKLDLKREDAFETAGTLTVSFGDDAILVDGRMNFAESSNVVLKNTALLSIFLAACYDDQFWHPRLLIMDNVEDKGMEPERSHNFQRIITSESEKIRAAHQIIFTTSMIAPELERKELTIGPRYTRNNKTLHGV